MLSQLTESQTQQFQAWLQAQSLLSSEHDGGRRVALNLNGAAVLVIQQAGNDWLEVFAVKRDSQSYGHFGFNYVEQRWSYQASPRNSPEIKAAINQWLAHATPAIQQPQRQEHQPMPISITETTTVASSQIVVTDIRMPFWSMVVFMVKAAIAAIPAMIILWLIGALLTAGFWVMIGGMGLLAGAVGRSAAQPTPTPVATTLPSPTLTEAVTTDKGKYLALRREDFGEAWPLKTSKARIWCEPGGALLLISDNVIYTVNGSAATLFGNQYRPIDDIWQDNADGSKKDMTPIITRGMELCQ